MKLPDPADAPARIANRILDSEDWARDKLAPFADRVVTLMVGPIATRFRITAEGRLDTAASSAKSDLDLKLSPLSVPAFLANPARWNEFVREEGDVELGGALKELARTLPWFIEAALAKALGPVAGQRAADAGRSLLAFPEYAAQRVTEGVASYARDESGLLAGSAQMPSLREGIREATERVEALERRFDALSARIDLARLQPLG
jgi:ubiquinone biosynthesis protein UbiJ